MKLTKDFTFFQFLRRFWKEFILCFVLTRVIWFFFGSDSPPPFFISFFGTILFGFIVIFPIIRKEINEGEEKK